MAVTRDNRRRADRFALPTGFEGSVEFGYPTADGHRCAMPLREVSHSGLSFVLTYELPGIEVGQTLKRAVLRAGSHAIRGDLVVIHLTPDAEPGAVCGAMFCPTGDADIVKMRALIAELDAARARRHVPL